MQQNSWRGSAIIIIVTVKEAVADYFEKVRGNINQWDGGNATNNLKDLLIERFASASIKDVWYRLDESKIIAINQTKKNVIDIIKDAPLAIQDVRVSVNLLVINASEENLLLGTD